MLSRLKINNFKCFDEVDVTLKPLTILCGGNGSGKSSFIQPLLLLRQTFEQGDLEERLLLHGKFIHIGSKQDCLNEAVENDWIGVTLYNNDKENIFWKFNAIEDNDSLPTSHIDVQLDDGLGMSALCNKMALFSNSNFSYISAERLGPRLSLPKNESEAQNNVGLNGELTGHFMAYNKDHKISGSRLLGGSIADTFYAQIEGWLEAITSNIRLVTDDLSSIDQMQIKYQSSTNTGLSNEHRATNIGFGVSYSLPIVASLLRAEKDSLLIIDTPEAHLHPKAQSRIGDLISRTANDGVQIIMETHSDHIINAVRVAIKEKMLSAEDVKLIYFSRGSSKDELISEATSIEINETGEILNWPDGFLDEWNVNLGKLLA